MQRGEGAGSATPRLRRLVVGCVAVAVAAALGLSPTAARAGRPGGTPKRPPAGPTVTVSSPSAGASLAGRVAVDGVATDGSTITSITVQVDGGPSTAATGTTSWTWWLDTTRLTNGSHTITATARDSMSLTASATVSVTIDNPTTRTFSSGGMTASDAVITNAATSDQLVLIDRGSEASWGTASATLYRGSFTWVYYVYLHDSATGATSTIALPGSTSSLIGNYAHAAFNGLGDLWIFGGGGPVTATEWTLSGGGALPTQATLVGSTTWGDPDSRAGALLRVASGGLVAVWRQQGASGPQGFGIAYRSPAGGWSVTYPLQFMPTASAKQAMAQNPADGSVWLFNDPDAYGAIGAAHFTEGPSGLTVDWTNPTLISETNAAGNGPDVENPDLEAVPDPSSGTVALAYQGQNRVEFSTNPWVVGSYPVVAHIAGNGSTSFLVLPMYVERITTLGLVVQGGVTWLMYRPVDPSTLTFTSLRASAYANGAWVGPAQLGTVADAYEVLDFGVAAPEVDAVLADGSIHQLRLSVP